MEGSQTSSPRLPLEMAMIAGLAAVAIAPLVTMLLDGKIAAPGLLFTVLPIALIALVLTRNPWLILIVVIVSAALLLGAIRSGQVQNRLAHPAAFDYFVVALLQTLGSAVAAVSGLGNFLLSFRARQSRSASQP